MTGQISGTTNTESKILSKSPCFAAVDLGASSGRVMAGQIVDERLQLQEMTRFSTAFKKDPGSKYACWAMDVIEEHMRYGIEQAAKFAEIRSVGVDSWGVDYVLLDDELHRVGPAICYRDDRTLGMMDRVASRMPAAEIYRHTGIQFQSFNTLYQLAAMAEQEPEWVKKARHLLMVPDYLHFRLCGVISNEYTDSTTTQILNLNGKWDRELLAAAGLSQVWMNPTVAAGTVLGEMRLGNSSIKVVAPATHDTASAVLGTPLKTTDEAYISSGTWSLMGIESLTPFASDAAMRMNFANEGGYGRRFRVLKNIMGLWIVNRLCEDLQIKIVDILPAVASATPWRSVLNPNDASFLNPPSMKEAVQEFCRKTHQPVPESPAAFVRCALESLALIYRLTKEELETLRGRNLTRIRIVGGGSKNRLLDQMCANACQLPVSAGPVEATALGNICAQMLALGEISNIDEARALIGRSSEIEEYQPQNAVPEQVWKQFQQYVGSSTQEEVR